MPARKKRSSTEETVPAAEEEMAVETDEELEAIEETEPEEPQYKEFHANEPFRYYIVTTQTQTPLVVFAGQEVR